ncbi:YopX family protein [Streptococcus parauberis]|uniref:YopX family protein n=1 Tax=Streptococcus parauberis TaxID=1348 RepID=UPI0003186895|nr:YopX family protein [Streptococcus parauberis]QBX17882.1 YopX superfamily protein [Streptococcus phage Javan383]UWM90205.1 YopX family protein [Streptococcus parauberis]
MIKFRAWDKNQQIMRGVRGLFWTKNNLVAHCSPMGNKFDEFFTTILNDGEYHLMQSTGLFDKNGVEIFEGDIVRVTDGDERTDFPDGGIGTICGLDDLYMWYIDGQVNNGLFDISEQYYIEVIGNIHEYPDLLESV